MLKLPFGVAFSHLNQSLLGDVINHNDQNVRYDQYGFRILTDNQINGTNENLVIDNNEEQIYNEIKAKWISFLEDEYRKLAPSSCLDPTEFDYDFIHMPRLDELICFGIVTELRPFFWIRLSRAIHLKIKTQWTFTKLIDLSVNEQCLSEKQIAQVLPNNICFSNDNSTCVTRLHRILRTLKWYHKTRLNETIENQLNLSLICAYLLLICSEEDTFWLLLKIASELNIDEIIAIIIQIMDKCCPIACTLLRKHDIEFKMIASVWFSTLFAGFVTSAKYLYNLWDLYFYEGPAFLIQITIGLMIKETKTLESCLDSKEFFNNLSDLPLNTFQSLEKIVDIWKCGKNIVTNTNLPSEYYHYEPMNNVELLLSQNINCKFNDKMKNIKQTWILMKLHESIVAIANHFQAYDFDTKYCIDADYDNVDKVDENDIINRLRPYKRRAKALMDFISNNKDELTFAKNDILTIINEKDEHCWIGELRGRIGWFPAKFVELLNERDQKYCLAGDDQVVPFINNLVRGKLSSALKSILSYDMKKSYFFTIHPWTIIEEISNLSTNADLKSVYSRLVLTKTFRLDENIRVLSPNDLLFRSISLINHTHGDLPMDIKFRSLICLGLNHFVLHDWFELICHSQPSIIVKSYGSNSFLTSPVWKMIKAELK